jgi:hypothetical protein
MTRGNTAKESARRVGRRRGVRVGAAASGLAVVMGLGCMAAVPAQALPTEPNRVHVEGRLVPMEKRPRVYRVTGGLVGTYKLRSERVIHAWTYWTTQIREIEGTESITGCVDQNQNENCDAGEPAGELRLSFNRMASFDTGTGRLFESRSTHEVISSGPFGGGALATRDIPVGNSDEILSTYEGDLQVKHAPADSKRTD